MQLSVDLSVRIRDAITRLGDTVPDRVGRQHNAIPLWADLGGAILLRADGTFLELEWESAGRAFSWITCFYGPSPW